MLTKKKFIAHGFTLVELLVALTINALLFSALIAIFIANVNHYTKTFQENRLNQQLETVLALMSDDIRRAGYWANASNDIGTNQNNNPFMTASTDISVDNTNDCILFTYDHDSNGSLPAINASIDDEHYGFRLSNNAVQVRPPGAGFSCVASGWENMTDTNIITITNLTFTLNTSTVTTGPGSQGITLRSVDISITGQLANNSSITKTLTQHVRLQNDKFIP